MLYSCNKNNNVSALDYILDSNFGSVQGRGTPMKLGFGSPKKRDEDPCSRPSKIAFLESFLPKISMFYYCLTMKISKITTVKCLINMTVLLTV
jgi:hypothetical protein